MDLVLIDESYKDVDYVIGRYCFGHVVIPEQSIVGFEEWFKNNIENDKFRFSIKGKLHFVVLTTSQQDLLVEKISKMPITLKVYITYISKFSTLNLRSLKLDLLIRSIRHHQMNKPGSKYFVEEASEYRSLKKQLPEYDLTLKTPKDYKAMLIPDIMLGVFCGFLDRDVSKRASDLDKWHTLIYNQIRLEVIDLQPKTKTYLIRDHKII